MAQSSGNLSYTMTKGEWKKAQDQLDRPVSMLNDGPRLRKGSQEGSSPASPESIFDGIENRVHKGRVKY